MNARADAGALAKEVIMKAFCRLVLVVVAVIVSGCSYTLPYNSGLPSDWAPPAGGRPAISLFDVHVHSGYPDVITTGKYQRRLYPGTPKYVYRDPYPYVVRQRIEFFGYSNFGHYGYGYPYGGYPGPSGHYHWGK